MRYVEGPAFTTERYSFNKEGLLLERVFLNRDGGVGWSERHEYQDGSVIGTTGGVGTSARTKPDEKLDWYEGAKMRRGLIRYGFSSIDDSGEKCRAAVVRGERPKCSYFKMRWDTMGNKATSEWYGQGNDGSDFRVTLATSLFDDSEREVETRFSNGGTLDFVLRYAYETDAVGNWIKQVEARVDPKSAQKTTQKITYRRIKYF